jgi:hypothetical protein
LPGELKFVERLSEVSWSAACPVVAGGGRSGV